MEETQESRPRRLFRLGAPEPGPRDRVDDLWFTTPAVGKSTWFLQEFARWTREKLAADEEDWTRWARLSWPVRIALIPPLER